MAKNNKIQTDSHDSGLPRPPDNVEQPEKKKGQPLLSALGKWRRIFLVQRQDQLQLQSEAAIREREREIGRPITERGDNNNRLRQEYMCLQ